MKKNSQKGNSTITGQKYEFEKDLMLKLQNSFNFSFKDKNQKKNYYELIYQDNCIGLILKKEGLYTFLAQNKINWKEILSAKLLPDQAIFILNNQTIKIIEIKYQEVAGSTDEKLQTCDFKKKQYQKLFKQLNISIEYIYLLNDWFKAKRYRDVLDYIKSVNCQYYFNELPIKEIFNLNTIIILK